MKANLFATILALGLTSVPVQAATYQFTVPFDVTFHVEGGEEGLPATAFFRLAFFGTPIVPFNPSDWSTWRDHFVMAPIEVFDGDGNLIPQPMANRIGGSLASFQPVCVCSYSLGGVAEFSTIVVTALDQTIHVKGFAPITSGYENVSAVVTAFVPDNLVPTSLPAALPLFASVLGVAAWFARRRQTSLP